VGTDFLYPYTTVEVCGYGFFVRFSQLFPKKEQKKPSANKYYRKARILPKVVRRLRELCRARLAKKNKNSQNSSGVHLCRKVVRLLRELCRGFYQIFKKINQSAFKNGKFYFMSARIKRKTIYFRNATKKKTAFWSRTLVKVNS